MELNLESIPFEELGPVLRGITYNGRAGLIARYAEGPAVAEVTRDAVNRAGSDIVLTMPAGPLSVETVVDAYLDHYSRTGSHPSTVARSESEAGLAHAAWLLEAPLVAGSSRFGSSPDTWGVTTARAQVVAGKVALVTGAAQGFGWEIAQGLAAAGAYVVIADLNRSGAEERAAQLGEITRANLPRGSHLGLPVDVSREESVRAMIDSIRRRYGGLDLVVSNAGVLKAGPVTDLALSDFELVTRVNFTGFFLVTKHAAPLSGLQNAAYRAAVAGREARARVDGTDPSEPGGAVPDPAAQDYDASAYFTDIVEMNSKSGLEGSNKNAAYAGSKFGGIGLVQSFALELVEHAIKVNALCPGNFLDGPLWSDPDRGLFVQYLRAGKVPGAKTIADVRAAYEAKVPMNRGCTGRDVVRALLYLVEQRYETGQALPITGGQVMLS